MRRSILLLTILVGMSVSISAVAQDAVASPTEEFMRATVLRILEEKKGEAFGFDRTSQQVILRITS